MKKTLKNIIISITIIYFVISLGYNIIFKGVNTEELQILDTGKSYVEIFEEKELKYKDIVKNTITTNLNMINSNLKIALFSIIIGGMIGLIKSTKENSNIKYIIYFIIGGVINTAVWTAVMIILYYKNGIAIEYIYGKIGNIFCEMFANTFLTYIFIYIAIIVINIVNNKIKVKQLNENLEGQKIEVKKDENRKEIVLRVKKILAITITIIVSLYLINIAKNIIILMKYSNAIVQMNEEENYYYRIDSTYTQEGREYRIDNIKETYYKEGIYLTKSSDNDILYEDTIKNEYIAIDGKNKKAYLYKRMFLGNKILNEYFQDTQVRKWQNFALAFCVKINVDDNSFEIIKDNTKLHIDKETYLPIKYINITEGRNFEGEFKSIMTEKYTYNINSVKNEDISKPDLTGYEKINM